MYRLPTIDLAIIAADLAAVVGLGLWLGRKRTTTDEFMAAGRSLLGWAVGLSKFGSYSSSISLLANPGDAYGPNWNFFAFSLAPTPIADAIAVRFRFINRWIFDEGRWFRDGGTRTGVRATAGGLPDYAH